MIFLILLIIKNISDSNRQQTTTVDNKQLFNGLLLTDIFLCGEKTNKI